MSMLLALMAAEVEKYEAIEHVVGRGRVGYADLSLSDVSPGDYLLYTMSAGTDFTGGTLPSSLTDWEQVYSVGSSGQVQMRVFGRFAPDPVPASLAPFADFPDQYSVHAISAFRNVKRSTPFSNTRTTASGAGRPNPPSIQLDHFGMIVGIGVGGSAQLYTAPSNYTLSIAFRSGDATPNTTTAIGAVYRLREVTGSNDPGTFGGSSTSGDYRAITVALRAKGT